MRKAAEMIQVETSGLEGAMAESLGQRVERFFRNPAVLSGRHELLQLHLLAERELEHLQRVLEALEDSAQPLLTDEPLEAGQLAALGHQLTALQPSLARLTEAISGIRALAPAQAKLEQAQGVLVPATEVAQALRQFAQLLLKRDLVPERRAAELMALIPVVKIHSRMSHK